MSITKSSNEFGANSKPRIAIYTDKVMRNLETFDIAETGITHHELRPTMAFIDPRPQTLWPQVDLMYCRMDSLYILRLYSDDLKIKTIEILNFEL
ncbi:hypothetical protein AKO1_005510 [Acrasis kona]|uniref:Uncharacterized protein n=1 Tax=Acrasis kona TaxID=1008807 RepID=A0AAW2YKN4_9EUKA